MAGVKRKLEATQASATSSGGHAGAGASQNTTNSTNDDFSSVRVTRSLRSSRDARASQHDVRAPSNTAATAGNGNNHLRNNTNRPSRIITLSTRAARANTAAENAAREAALRETAARENVARENTARETRNTRTRASAQLATAQPETPVTAVPETPRHKRVKRGPTVEETPRTTRQSARLRAHVHPTSAEDGSNDQGIIPKFSEPSPSTTAAPSTRTRNRSRQFADNIIDTTHNATSTAPAVKSPSPDRTTPVPAEQPRPPQDEPQSIVPDLHLFTKEESPKGTVVDEDKSGVTEPAARETADRQNSTTTPSPEASEKPKSSSQPEDTGAAESESVSESPSKKPKVEEGELEHALDQQLQNGTGGNPASRSPAEAVADSRIDYDSRQVTEEIEGSTPEVATESTAGKPTRGGRTRGRGRGGRSRGSARFAVNKRGRGAARSGRGGRTGRQLDRSSDVEPDRSPSPSAATQKLRDRQRELDKAFKKVAAAQRLALAVLATQSEKRLARDKNAHKNVPEFEEVNMQLKERLNGRKEVLRREYELKVAQEHRLFEANKQAIEERYRAQARNIREEHLLASQGAYMTFVEGRRAAEDDEHTETDDSETEPERGRVVPPAREVFRGFNSNYVRNPSGAALYDRAYFGWDDFVQRAKVGDDIDPQMKEIRDAGPFAGMTAEQILDMLVKATGVVEVPRNTVPAEISPPVVLPDLRPRALSALADIAAAEPPRPPLSQAAPRLSTHRALLPQPAQPPLAHGPAETRPFVLPPPTPQRQQPRRLLPAGQQIPPINEQLGLPDPFASMGGPPHLPPPPGSNFHRPPLPGFMTGHHPPSLYYPPPPPPPPPGPRPPF
ncbi:hypothetical protein AtubIFM56815_011194 [Aspergillus tubingensis]|uniref:Uncharacterized protein n=1 Tax=Aspergillus tubingensis TaxID=5068 RepID=A0A8H3T4W2_ASPTU|nr:histone chaperone domain CHZ family protein [Aspergillus tubingensis]GFN20455.1 histone chaperone domain CHZ family protein [Aspergillus tubingensis]GLA57566.1 hypothetical protein AtubIFM54640_005358 [Aspergillus tubingensis]GLA86923.1 hypothetical protein AtubIFM56815_011194 [Aspergillus tubingensis]